MHVLLAVSALSLAACDDGVDAPTFRTGATPLYSADGFEAPTYAIGAADGQDGWSIQTPADASGTSSLEIQSAVALSGSAALEIVTTPDVTEFPSLERALVYDSATGTGLVRIETDFMVSGHDPARWIGLGVYGENGLVAMIEKIEGRVCLDSTFHLAYDCGVRWRENVWYHLEIDLDFENQRVDAYVDGASIGWGPFTNPATTLDRLTLGSKQELYAPLGLDQMRGYWDDLQITEGEGTTCTLEASADTNVRSRRPTNNYGDHDRMHVRPMNGDETNIRRSLVAFDMSTCLETGAAPPSTLPFRGVLSLSNDGETSLRSHDVARVEEPWDELTVTWDDQPAVGDVTDTALVDSAVVEWNVTADVSEMVRGTVDDYGWLVSVDDESQDGDGSSRTRYYTREHSVEDERPRLILTY